MTRSELERPFLALVADTGLPPPEVNGEVEVSGDSHEIDMTWAAHRLALELDGFETHRTCAAFERDRARDRDLQLAGWRVTRVTWWQLHHEPALVAHQLRAFLDA